MIKMTWEETIKSIRTQAEYKELIELAYFEERLELNVERFVKSEEFDETKKLISTYAGSINSKKLLDIGSGNGISAVAFALEGLIVDSIEPDPSETIGAGAIKKLKEHFKLGNLNVHQSYAEELKFTDNSFDIVYARQCMHHAHDLTQFILESARVLKKGGLLFTVRDHVVFDEADKKWFLETHPLQKFYGGENAFNPEEYKNAMLKAGFEIKQEIKHFENVINYFPLSRAEKKKKEDQEEEFIKTKVKNKLGILNKVGFMRRMATNYLKGKAGPFYDEKKVPGRMYSYIAVKK